MGNSCFCDNIHFIKDVKLNVCFQKQDINNKSDHIIIKDDHLNTNEKKQEKENKKVKPKNKMFELINYFNEGEKEIINNFKKKQKLKKIPTKKKNDLTLDFKEDNKYELMLKRLLEQQNIKKIGPKRRETIRKAGEEKIKEIVKNLLVENKNDVLKNKKNENNTLLIKKQFQKKGRFSVTIDRNMIFSGNVNNKKKLQEQYFNNRNTLCEVIPESNGDMIHKQNSNES